MSRYGINYLLAEVEEGRVFFAVLKLCVAFVWKPYEIATAKVAASSGVGILEELIIKVKVGNYSHGILTPLKIKLGDFSKPSTA